MTVEELNQKIANGETPCVLDVREAWELDTARYPFDVVHIPMGSIKERASELPKDREIVCACRSGGRSAQVVAFLNGQGYSAVNLDGGILAWSARIDPSIPRY